MRNWFSLLPDPKAEIVVVVPLDGEVAEMPGAARIQSNMLLRRVGIDAISSTPNRVLKSWITGLDPRAGTLDANGFGHARDAERNRPFQGGAAADADVLFVIRHELLPLHVERVDANRQGREPQLPRRRRGQTQGTAESALQS